MTDPSYSTSASTSGPLANLRLDQVQVLLNMTNKQQVDQITRDAMILQNARNISPFPVDLPNGQ